MLYESLNISREFLNLLSKINNPIAEKLLDKLVDIEFDHDYLDISISRGISAVPVKKLSDGDNWKNPNIKDFKTGRLIQKILKTANIPYTPAELEDFVNKWNGVLTEKPEITVISGDAIVDIYNVKSLDKSGGNLDKSCLNGKPRAYFNMFRLNPDRVKMVILKRGGELAGRALLWTTDNIGGFVDRIYCNIASDVEVIKQWATEMGYWYKEKQESSYKNRIDMCYTFRVNKGKLSKEPDITVSLDNIDDLDFYPYLDSLCYYNSETGQLSNNGNIIDADLLLCNTDGGSKPADFEW